MIEFVSMYNLEYIIRVYRWFNTTSIDIFPF